MNKKTSKPEKTNWRRVLELGLALWALVTVLNFAWREPPFFSAWPEFLRLLFLKEGPALDFHGAMGLPSFQALLFFFMALVPGFVLVKRRLPEASLSATLAAAVVVGWGLWMIIAEIPAIFFRLSTWSILLAWLLLCAVAFLIPKSKMDRSEIQWSWLKQEKWEKVVWVSALALVVLITILTFYHALVFPVVYWDSLILYVDYGQQTYLQSGFPVIVCAQVGIGLGANYPHLFPLTAASMGKLWGEWNDRHAQFIGPFCGLLASVLLYHLLVRRWNKPWVAMLGVLLFRSIPYATFYFIYPTDYAVAMLLVVLFLWGLSFYVQDRRSGGFEMAGLAVAMGMHLNYLAGILGMTLAVAPLFLYLANRKKQSLLSCYWPKVLTILIAAALLGSGWYIRNWIVTGNPVYAFFPEIFGGKNINLEVLQSCFVEWRANGDGIGRFGDTIGEKFLGLPRFLFTEMNYHWKYGPALTGLALPGIFIAFWNRCRVVCWIAALVGLTVTAYHFFLADLYLYHTLMIAPVAAFFGAALLGEARSREGRMALAASALVIGFVVGGSAAIVGGKWMSFRPLALELPAVAQLEAGGKPGWPEKFDRQFLELRLGDSYRMWRFMNRHLGDTAVLTHENRHHYIRRDIELVGLDDCRLTDWYDQPFEQVAERLEQLGIEYYLRIPNENNHPIIQRLGVGENLEEWFEPFHREGNEDLFRFPGKRQQNAENSTIIKREGDNETER